MSNFTHSRLLRKRDRSAGRSPGRDVRVQTCISISAHLATDDAVASSFDLKVIEARKSCLAGPVYAARERPDG